MFSRNLRLALRRLGRHKGIAAINVLGLSVGIATCLLIFLFVQDELRYDRQNEKADRIYRVVETRIDDEGQRGLAVTPPALAPALDAELPQVVETVRFYDMRETLVQRGDQQFFESPVLLADATVFDVFTLPLLEGDPKTALTAPFSLVISQSIAREYFGDDDPMGQQLTLSNSMPFTVTGVMADDMDHTHLPAEMLGSFSTMYSFATEERLSDWIWQQFYSYVLLEDAADAGRVTEALPGIVERLATPQTSSFGFKYTFRLQPLADIYLHSAGLELDLGPRSNVQYVYAFACIAVFILLIACFNFMNLSTSQSLPRAREVGTRKAMGARSGQLVWQFLGESVLMTVLALAIALFLALAVLPYFNAFTGKSLGLGRLVTPWTLGTMVVGTLLVSVLAGGYPAFLMSSMRPVRVLKGLSSSGRSTLGWLRKGLIVLQFAISIALLVGTSVIYRQLDYIQHKDLGFDDALLVSLPLRGDQRTHLNALKQELLRAPGITAVTGSWGRPGDFTVGDDVRIPGRDATWSTNMYIVDADFLDTYGMEVVAGRGFSDTRPTDEQDAFVINETAARALGWGVEGAVGKEMSWDRWSGGVKKGHVIGVVRDFHFKSFHQQIEPLVMHIYPKAFGFVTVRIRPEHIQQTLAGLERTWKEWAPSWPFKYDFVDQDVAAQYTREVRLGQVNAGFSLLATLIACLGLLGLSALAAQRRLREIGVRKVFGASTARLVGLLSKDFSMLVLLAFAIAAPLAYFAMASWLDDFAYRIDLGPGPVLLAGGLVLVVAWLTVSYQAIRAARTNPVDVLRYE